MRSILLFYIAFVLFTTGHVSVWLHILLFLVIVLLTFSKLDWKRRIIARTDIKLFILYLIISLLAFFQSKSIPLSFESLSLSLFSFIVYVYFLSVPKKVISLGHLIKLIMACVALLSVAGIVSFSYGIQNTGELTFSSIYYGHNHIAVLILLVLPFSYFFANTKKSPLWKVLLVFFFISLIFSLSRVAIVIGMILLFLVSKKISEYSVFMRNILFIVFSLSVLVLISTSFPQIFLKEYCSSFMPFKTVFCKDIRFDARAIYWRQGLYALENSPLIGIGPGTYEITNDVYRLIPSVASNNLHNIYIEEMVETGLFGGIVFISLITLLVLKSLESKKIDYWLYSIGLIGIHVSNFFNPDFNILAIQFLIFSGYGMMFNESKQKKPDEKTRILSQIIILAICFLLIFVSVNYFFEKQILSTEKNKIRKNFFLYSDHAKLYFNHYDYDELYFYFRNHIAFHYHYYNSTNDEYEKDRIFTNIAQLSPGFVINPDAFEYYKKKGDLFEYESKLYQALKQINALSNSYFWHHENRLLIMEEFLLIYDEYLKNKRFADATRITGRIFEAYKFVFTDTDTLFRYTKVDGEVIENSSDLYDFMILYENAISQHIPDKYLYYTEETRIKIANLYIEASNAVYPEDPIQALDLYHIAFEYYNELNELSFSYFSKIRYQDLTPEESVSFAQKNRSYSGPFVFFRHLEIVQIYQVAANFLLAQERYDEAEQILKDMQDMTLRDEPYSFSQLGNYYLSRYEFDLAREEFNECIESFEYVTYLCEAGLVEANARNDQSKLFKSTANYILSEKYIR